MYYNSDSCKEHHRESRKRPQDEGKNNVLYAKQNLTIIKLTALDKKYDKSRE